jgi:hypothetical protein
MGGSKSHSKDCLQQSKTLPLIGTSFVKRRLEEALSEGRRSTTSWIVSSVGFHSSIPVSSPPRITNRPLEIKKKLK